MQTSPFEGDYSQHLFRSAQLFLEAQSPSTFALRHTGCSTMFEANQSRGGGDMKIGLTLQLTSFGDKSDLQTYQEELALADQAEGLGFDSVWALDHHFTGYVMSPDPTQLLSYVAARTKRVELGTAVIVLPWHDPVHIAEKIALLDTLSGGRTIFGFGRGAASIEYAGFRIPQEEARDRFVECCLIIRKALTQEHFSFDGKYYKIPEISIRPRPISHPERRFYASSVSPESAEIMAKQALIEGPEQGPRPTPSSTPTPKRAPKRQPSTAICTRRELPNRYWKSSAIFTIPWRLAISPRPSASAPCRSPRWSGASSSSPRRSCQCCNMTLPSRFPPRWRSTPKRSTRIVCVP